MRPSLRGGVAAGIIGGTAMAGLMFVVNLAHGTPWIALEESGIAFLGARALQPGFDGFAVFIGVATHGLVSGVWGALFGSIVWGLSRSATAIVGPLYGVLVWLGMFYVVLPILGLGAIAQHSPRGLSLFEHVVFGTVVAFAFAALYQRPARTRRIVP